MGITSNTINKKGFTELFIRANGLDAHKFKEWLLCSGMLFHASNAWWGRRGERNTPHAGLDLCFYRTAKGATVCFDGDEKIPAMHDGTVAAMIKDFLGTSLILKGLTPDPESNEFVTIYGHTEPGENISLGKRCKAGEIIARVAKVKKSPSGVVPHLHLSMGSLANKATPCEELDWHEISDPKIMTLADPLQILAPYALVPESELFP